jgi:hypothetical protein
MPSQEVDSTADQLATDSDENAAETTAQDQNSAFAVSGASSGPAPGTAANLGRLQNKMSATHASGEQELQAAQEDVDAADQAVSDATGATAAADAQKEKEVLAPQRQKLIEATDNYQNVIKSREASQLQMNQQLDTLQRMSGVIASTTIRDPWADASTPVKIGGLLALALGGFQSGAFGGPNAVANELDRIITRDISLQSMNLQNKQRGLENGKSLLAQFRENTDHAEHAQDLAYQAASQGIEKRLEMAMKTTTDPQRRAALQATLAAYQQKTAQAKMKSVQTLVGKQYAGVKDETTAGIGAANALRQYQSAAEKQSASANKAQDNYDKEARATINKDPTLKQVKDRAGKIEVALSSLKQIAKGDLNNITDEQAMLYVTQIAAGELGRPAQQLIETMAPGATLESKAQALKTFLLNDPQARKAGGFLQKSVEQGDATLAALKKQLREGVQGHIKGYPKMSAQQKRATRDEYKIENAPEKPAGAGRTWMRSKDTGRWFPVKNENVEQAKKEFGAVTEDE